MRVSVKSSMSSARAPVGLGFGQPQRTAGDQQIVEHAHAREDARELEHAQHAEPCQRLGPQPGDRAAVESDLTGIRRRGDRSGC